MRPTSCYLAVALVLIGCGGGSPLTSLRFYNRDPVWAVQDRVPIAQPQVRKATNLTDEIDALVRRSMLHGLALPDPVTAKNVNSLGEVPDSSWFQNRAGVRDLTPEEIARGPNTHVLDRTGPLLVHEIKVNHHKVRFLIEDAAGARYILKFDTLQAPELETGPDVVVQRLLWAAGYNVPENSIVELDPKELVQAEGSQLEVTADFKRPLSAHTFAAALELAGRSADGRRLRALASRYLEGKPIGGYAMEGVRPDDPNDRVPHEHRRDVRGLRLFFAWLAQTDVKEPNTLDMWVEEPQGSRRGSVTHYVLDFSKALGTWADEGHEHDGYAPHFDYGYALVSLLGLGLWPWPWETAQGPGFRGVGRYQAAGFEPEAYSEANPYAPFLWTDRFDDFWAAKIIARLRPELIAAAVEQARYTDPDASRYLVTTIVERQRKVLRSAFGRVNPLDGFTPAVKGRREQLCFRDLMIEHDLVPPQLTRYVLRAYDYAGRELDYDATLAARAGGAVCTPALVTGKTDGDYTLVAIWTRRGEQELAPVIVHLAREPKSGRLRVIGVERK